MIIEKSKYHDKEMVIDLTGPMGNAFVLIGYAIQFAKQLKMSKEATDLIISEMKEGDYEHLLEVFDKNFGKYVILLR